MTSLEIKLYNILKNYPKLITYRELSNLLDRENGGKVRSNKVKIALFNIDKQCRVENLPPISARVIDDFSGIPGKGYFWGNHFGELLMKPWKVIESSKLIVMWRADLKLVESAIYPEKLAQGQTSLFAKLTALPTNIGGGR